jgi:hypothetical protein
MAILASYIPALSAARSGVRTAKAEDQGRREDERLKAR